MHYTPIRDSSIVMRFMWLPRCRKTHHLQKKLTTKDEVSVERKEILSVHSCDQVSFVGVCFCPTLCLEEAGPDDRRCWCYATW